jgi:nucleotide-binding universal stress UspA family protein
MFERILLAVDGSEPSMRAARVAGELGGKLGAEVVVLHIRERMAGRIRTFDLETAEEAHDLVDRTVAELKNAGVSARGEVGHGIAGYTARVIIEAAETEDAGMIVMGSRGLTDFGGLFLGSVAHRVLHLAEMPVTVVR